MAKYTQKMGGKEVGQASVYAKPHTMEGKECCDYGIEPTLTRKKNWVPLAGVSINVNEQKSGGIQMRGTGAATKGKMSRGPMA
jgi:hypothetical protein